MTPEQAASKYSWIKISKEDGVTELYCDHHMLQAVRLCEAYFVEYLLNQTQQKGRFWSLEFGTWFHKCMEWFDEAESHNWNSNPNNSGIECGWFILEEGDENYERHMGILHELPKTT